ncbi:MAG: type II secretion system F family protein [Desulfurobacteriaceae bacterium]
MAVFSYKGIDRNGREIKGIIEANSKANAIALLKSKGIFPYELKEEKTENKNFSLFPVRKNPFSQKELGVFFKTLSNLLEAGIPLVEALESFINEVQDNRKKAFISQILVNLKEGKSFSESLKLSKVTDPVILAFVSSGEKGGFLAENLLTLSDILERKEEVRSTIVGALIYPVILVVVSLGVIVFMLTTVVPKIVSIYDSMKLSLPLSTKIVLAISNFLVNDFWFLLLSILVLALLFSFLIRKKKKTIDKLKLKTPILGFLFLCIELLYFFETLGNLLKAGIPIGEAINFSINALRNEYLQEMFLLIKEEVERGERLTKILTNKLENVPFIVVQLIKAGEKSGSLADMFLKSSEFLKVEINTKIKNLTSLFESIIMLIVGMVIGFIIIALLLPIVEISTIKKL